MQVETVTAVRYVTPLREGGSLPAIVEADDGVLYAMKFAGAGQGVKALIADLVCAELGRVLGLRVPVRFSLCSTGRSVRLNRIRKSAT